MFKGSESDKGSSPQISHPELTWGNHSFSKRIEIFIHKCCEKHDYFPHSISFRVIIFRVLIKVQTTSRRNNKTNTCFLIQVIHLRIFVCSCTSKVMLKYLKYFLRQKRISLGIHEDKNLETFQELGRDLVQMR